MNAKSVRTTLKPWLKPLSLVFTGESFFSGFLGGAGFRPSTVHDLVCYGKDMASFLLVSRFPGKNKATKPPTRPGSHSSWRFRTWRRGVTAWRGPRSAVFFSRCNSPTDFSRESQHLKQNLERTSEAKPHINCMHLRHWPICTKLELQPPR